MAQGLRPPARIKRTKAIAGRYRVCPGASHHWPVPWACSLPSTARRGLPHCSPWCQRPATDRRRHLRKSDRWGRKRCGLRKPEWCGGIPCASNGEPRGTFALPQRCFQRSGC